LISTLSIDSDDAKGVNMIAYDPRKISIKVYGALKQLKQDTPNVNDQDKQKGQAVELYTYISTWGLLRLKGEEASLANELQKQKVVQRFFKVLGELAYANPNSNPLETDQQGMTTLVSMPSSEYLGLMGLALQVAQEFSFWAEAIYPKTTTPKTMSAQVDVRTATR
jgi:muconolactone delta-isomerase